MDYFCCDFHFSVHILCNKFLSEVHFKHYGDQKAESIRNIRAEQIGKLVVVRGIVTRCTEVKPIMSVATYTCDRCGAESYQPVSNCKKSMCNNDETVKQLFRIKKDILFVEMFLFVLRSSAHES